MEKLNFEAGWNSIWDAVRSAIPNITTILGVLGTALIAYALFKFLMDKRKGSGGNTKELVWTLIFAALLMLTNPVMKILLRFAAFVANFFIGLAGGLK